ncbi:hypothetical protein SETIT_8G222100v2 [Setaria italica]|uniref:Bifunctional inhibitor/plant lipid transfer protein/seed storage helical domain-containing protein n=1 Tax=Setaria italica TaxID=4555 RepID=A0A368SAD5_SETIT|nr:hypothetical protein SETIT_8G222100v2 [Setaria italica]
MAPKSAAALVLLAAMIAGLAPPLQAQIHAPAVTSFLLLVDAFLCSSDDAMKSCARQLVASGGAKIPPDCCRAILKAVTSGEGKRCACGFGVAVATKLRVDVDRRCQAASNGSVAGGPSKLMELCGPARPLPIFTIFS